jgi:hypothetical protein
MPQPPKISTGFNKNERLPCPPPPARRKITPPVPRPVPDRTAHAKDFID